MKKNIKRIGLSLSVGLPLMTMTDEARQNFENTDYALKLYNKTHRDRMDCPPFDLNKPQFSVTFTNRVPNKNRETTSFPGPLPWLEGRPWERG